MHIAIFEVLRSDNERARERLGRRYVMGIEDIRLTVHRGGKGHAPSVHVERFETHDELITNSKEKIRRRFYNGYVLTWWSKGFLLLDWIREHDYPVEYRPTLPPGIQLELPFIDWPSTR